MKKLIIFSLVSIFALTSVLAQANFEETIEENKVVAELAVMAGPTGFSSAKIARDNGDISPFVKVNTSVYSSPTEVVAKLTNGEVDVAALPTNLSAILYNKGVDIKLAAVIGNGMLSVVSANDNWMNDTIMVPGGPSSTPNQIASMLIEKNGYTADDFDLDFSITSSAQLAQLLIANKASAALLPEPFLTMVLTKNPNLEVVLDVQDLYGKTTSIANYPMTVIVVQDEFAKENPVALAEILEAYEASVEFVLTNPKDAAETIGEIGILPAAIAEPAIPNCNLTYKDVDAARAEVETYFNLLFNFNKKSVGGKLPDEGFYL